MNYFFRHRKLVIVTCGLVIVAAIFNYLHHREITNGSFLNLTIGETKEDAFLNLLESGNLEWIQPKVYENVYVSNENIDDASKLGGFELLIFRNTGQRGALYVHLKNGEVTHVVRNDYFQELSEISVGRPFEEFYNAVVSFLASDTARISTSVGDYRAISISKGSDIIGSIGYADLLAHDRWRYKILDAWIYVDLFFENDHLIKIEYKNNFIELP